MKKLFIVIQILFSVSISAQNHNKIKVDTLYFSGNIPKINESLMRRILIGVENTCDPNQEEIVDDKVEWNREFRTISTLKRFNKEASTSGFTDSDALLISYFCNNFDYADQIEMFEFIFKNENAAQNLMQKLIYLQNKIGQEDNIGFKNWYFKRIKSRVYFIDYKQESLKNSIVEKLKSNIESLSK